MKRSRLNWANGGYRDVTEGITVACATDGNHGRAVARSAQLFHCWYVIFLHGSVSQGRADARSLDTVRRVPGTYDDVPSGRPRNKRRRTSGSSSRIRSWSGYSEVLQQIMRGYRLMADEAADQWRGERPTHVFVQAGVGGVAAAVSVQMRARFEPAPELIVVEPIGRPVCWNWVSPPLSQAISTRCGWPRLCRAQPGSLAGAQSWCRGVHGDP
jgi:diaminopropionate ammonia-lyase